jgi:hypothetical protein
MNNIRWVNWADAIGKKLIKEVQVEIHNPHIEKKCIKCEKIFIYKHSDDTEKLQRILYFNKFGNLDVCLDCDK